jgi:hypothetical protein
MKKTNKRKNEKLLPFEVIEAATNGDAIAMETVLRHFAGYICALSTRCHHDKYGNVYSYVDENVRSRIEAKLIYKTVTKFKPEVFP